MDVPTSPIVVSVGARRMDQLHRQGLDARNLLETLRAKYATSGERFMRSGDKQLFTTRKKRHMITLRDACKFVFACGHVAEKMSIEMERIDGAHKALYNLFLCYYNGKRQASPPVEADDALTRFEAYIVLYETIVQKHLRV